MKKTLSILLTACLIVSAFAIFSIPASATDKAWVVYGNAKDHRDGFNEAYGDEYSNVPGYEYVNDGLQTISPEWENTSPKVGVQTGNKVNLKNGVYMLVRIDEFSYDAGDKWFAFSISDTQYVDVGSTNKEKDGERIVAMIRGNSEDMRSEVEWRQSNYVFSGKSSMSIEAEDRFDADGKEHVILSISWDGSSYNVTVNGATIAPSAQQWMNEHFADGEAYVGINIYNNKKGGEAGLTVLKYGNNEHTALTPNYDDSQEPINNEARYTIADIQNANTVPAGQPGVFLNGNRDESDSKTTTKSEGIYSLTEEGYKHVVSDRDNVETTFVVKNSVSYDIKDFPVALVLTRNLCTCNGSTGCWAMEQTEMYIMAGDEISATASRKVGAISAGVTEPIECDGDNYLYFMINFLEVEHTADVEGRINALRFDIPRIKYTTPGRNEFDICFVAFFRNKDEARAYVNDYLGLEYDDGSEGGESDDYENGFNDGYENGFGDGYDEGIFDGYENGFDDGYDEGEFDGYESGFDDGHKSGYEEGKSDGYESGFDDGHKSGYEEGKSDGYESGFDDGYEEGKSDGYESGFDDGYEEGESDGYESGFDDGYEEGESDGYESGFDDGYENGYEAGKSEAESTYEKGFAAGYEEAKREFQNNSIIANISSLPSCQGAIGSGMIILIALIFPTALLIYNRKKDE